MPEPLGPVSVVVPTYRRPEYLRRCLEGLRLQSHAPAEVVIVRRLDDQETCKVVSEFADRRVKEVTVAVPGVLAAMARGTREATGAIIAFTDDDAIPRPGWLEQLLPHFDDPSVGGVGGRDVLQPAESFRRPLTNDVGRITAWGKVVGNHHLGTGPPRDVMVLKGVNMAFRKEALSLPIRLRGTGAQRHLEVATCLSARRCGWRLIYDPAAIVDHYPGPRFDGDQREAPEAGAVRDAAYNLVFCLLALEPRLYWRRAAYGLTVGDRAAPGLARAAAAALRGERDVLRGLVPSIQGQLQALVDLARGRRPTASASNEVGARVGG